MTQPDAPAPSQAPEHSPTPWRAYGDIINDADGMWIGEMIGLDSRGQLYGNAAFAVHRVNAYASHKQTIAALVEALEPFADAASVFEREYGQQMTPETGCNIKFSALCAARAALALARSVP